MKTHLYNIYVSYVGILVHYVKMTNTNVILDGINKKKLQLSPNFYY